MPPVIVAKVVNCGVRWNAHAGRYRAWISVQESTTTSVRYNKVVEYWDQWSEVVDWFQTFGS